MGLFGLFPLVVVLKIENQVKSSNCQLPHNHRSLQGPDIKDLFAHQLLHKLLYSPFLPPVISTARISEPPAIGIVVVKIGILLLVHRHSATGRAERRAERTIVLHR